MSDADRGPGYAGPTRTDQDTDRADDAGRGSDAPTSPQSSSSAGDQGEYGTTTQTMRAVAPDSPAPANGSTNGSPGSANGPGGYSPWGPYRGSTYESGSPQGQPGNGNGYYTPGPEISGSVDAPGDGLPDGGQAAPTWEPVASRSKKPLKERWTDFTGKLTGRDEATAAETDSQAAERLWASSAAAGGSATAVAVGSDEQPVTSPDQESEAAPAPQAATEVPAPEALAGPPAPQTLAPSGAIPDVEAPTAQPVVAREDSVGSPLPPASPWAPAPEPSELAGPPTGPQTAVIPVVEGQQTAPDFPQAYETLQTPAPKPKAGTPHRTRKARLRLSRLDPWSVMKTSFLFSIAAGIMLVVAVYVVWTVIGSSGLFTSVNDIVKSVISTPNDTTPFRIEEYINTQKVLGVAALLACVDVIIFTALATLGSFLYNLAATMLGGLEITLAED